MKNFTDSYLRSTFSGGDILEKYIHQNSAIIVPSYRMRTNVDSICDSFGRLSIPSPNLTYASYRCNLDSIPFETFQEEE